MKRCPTCDRTFDDSLRFCQTDGTALVEDAPLDPYKTMVARPADIAAAMPPEPAKEDEEVLEIPGASDPLKTMYASEEEIRKEMAAHDSADEPMMEIPPMTPEPPKFSEPSVTPPPSPFAAPEPEGEPFAKTSPPIPSPFDSPKPASFEPPPFEPPAFEPPPTPNFPQYSEPVMNEPSINPFDQPFTPPQADQSLAQAEWTPPPVPDAGWQNQPIGQNTPFQPPPGGAGPSSVLAIISLALGIIGLLTIIPTLLIWLCGILPFFLGIASIITGFLAKSRVKSMPDQYGGSGLATFGLILGVIDVIAPFVIAILMLLLWGGLAAIGNLGNS